MNYKCISIRQPWADAILSQGKNIENRNWNTNYRGEVLIHASARTPKSDYADAQFFIKKLGIQLLEKHELGAIIGSVEIVGCEFSDVERGWGMGGYYWWKLANPKLVKPILFKGKLGIYTVDLESLEYL